MIRGTSTAFIPDNNRKGTYTVGNSTIEKDIALTLSPATGTFSSQTPLNLDIYLNASTHTISGISFVLHYDNSLKLQRADIDKNTFNNILRDTISQNTYTFTAVDITGKTITGKTKIGTLTFIPQAQKTNAIVSFSDVQITDTKTVGNISKESYPNAGVYTLQDSAIPTTIPTIAEPTKTVPTKTPIPTTSIIPTTVPTGPPLADATGDRLVDIRDYNVWKDEYLGLVTTKRADFNKDGRVDLIDFSIFRNGLNP